ncbi:Rieske (2Fe-2S) protein [Pseudonocardia sp. K10HN5]|uniref:Cytochrome bc1 complex Rieske iron-sulfur subunit n=2 Tax=Pseudonocardia acidicola TaxID=2724939 RepID=A0ABX1S9G3_9PSEU|nr:Rieske (2Fe-2S) protein [Pseudonocardia acidicola]
MLISRRVAVAGAGALATVVTLGGGVESCSGSSPSSGGGSHSSGGAAGTHELAKTSDIAVGGATIFPEWSVVVTQPTSGQFNAYSARCTHEGCLLNSVAAGTINCPCHGSRFTIADGSVAHGPARRPLNPVTITVRGESIILG